MMNSPTPGLSMEITDPKRCDSLLASFFRLYKKPNTMRNPSPNPRSISRELLSSMNPNEYGISEKTDGVRYNLLLCRDHLDRPTSCMIDRKLKLFEVGVSCGSEFFEGSLFDGELVWERIPTTSSSSFSINSNSSNNINSNGKRLRDKEVDGYKGRLVWFAFDVVSCSGRSMITENYLSRIECINNCFHDPIEGTTLLGDTLKKRMLELSSMRKIASCGQPHDMIFRPKNFVSCSNIDYLWNSISTLLHSNDGLIFIPLNDGIQTGTHWKQYKWKYEHTVDLQLRAKKKEGDGGWILGLYYLEADFTVSMADSKDRERITEEEGVAKYLNACTGIEFEGKMVYFVLEMNKLIKDLLNEGESSAPSPPEQDTKKKHIKCIIEFGGRFDQSNRFICTAKKIRSDKFEPNNRYTVRQTLLNIRERITIDEIRHHLLSSPTITTDVNNTDNNKKDGTLDLNSYVPYSPPPSDQQQQQQQVEVVNNDNENSYVPYSPPPPTLITIN